MNYTSQLLTSSLKAKARDSHEWRALFYFFTFERQLFSQTATPHKYIFYYGTTNHAVVIVITLPKLGILSEAGGSCSRFSTVFREIRQRCVLIVATF